MEGGSKSSPEPDGLPQRSNRGINRETKYSQTTGEKSTAAILVCGVCSVSFSEIS